MHGHMNVKKKSAILSCIFRNTCIDPYVFGFSPAYTLHDFTTHFNNWIPYLHDGLFTMPSMCKCATSKNHKWQNMGFRTVYGTGQQPLSWSISRAASGKITLSGITNRLNYCHAYSIYIIYKCGASRIIKPGGPRVWRPRYRL